MLNVSPPISWVSVVLASTSLASVSSVNSGFQSRKVKTVDDANAPLCWVTRCSCASPHSMGFFRALLDANDLLRSTSVRGAARILYLGISCERYSVRPKSVLKSPACLDQRMLLIASKLEGDDLMPVHSIIMP